LHPYFRNEKAERVEFRVANTSPNLKMSCIKAVTDYFLALSVASLHDAKIASMDVHGKNSYKSMREHLESIGLVGPEFATTRALLGERGSIIKHKGLKNDKNNAKGVVT
jgi:hypothetical protein